MKPMKIKVIFLLIAVMIISSPAFCQENEETINLRSFGLGLNVNQLRMLDILTDISMAPANKIFITITPNRFFRIEPEVGYLFTKDKERDLKGKMFQYGLGGYGMYQRGKTNFFIGLKFEHSIISQEYSGWPEYLVNTEKIKRFGIGPAIGAEYFFNEHFSFGGQASILYLTLKSEDTRSSYYDIDAYNFITETGLTLRFYF